MVAPRFDQYVIDQTTLQLQSITTSIYKQSAQDIKYPTFRSLYSHFFVKSLLVHISKVELLYTSISQLSIHVHGYGAQCQFEKLYETEKLLSRI
jgi:hypothetical protein